MFNVERKCNKLSLDQFTKQQLQEMPLIEVAYYYIAEEKEAVSFNEIVKMLTQTLGLSQQQISQKISQFYTELNIDGRFLCLGENRWGLRSWYPTNQVEEETVTVIRPRKKKKQKATDDFDDYDELVEEEYSDEEELDDDDDDLDEETDDEQLTDDDESAADLEFEEFEEVADELIDDDEFVDEQFDDDDDEK